MQEAEILQKSTTLQFKKITIAQQRAGQYQPRQTFSQEGLNSLSEMIKKVRILEPILVISLTNQAYEIIAGRRGWRAAQMAGLKKYHAL